MKRAALHELIEFVTASSSSTNGSNNAQSNNNGNNKDKDSGDSTNKAESNEVPNLSMLTSGFEPTFYEEMVLTVSVFDTFLIPF